MRNAIPKIPKPESQTVGCVQALGSLEGINILWIWRSMIGCESLCIAKGSTSTCGSMPEQFEVR